MSDFKAKMHQIVCRLGLRPRPPSWILGGLLLRGGEGTRGEGKGRKEGREGRGRGGIGEGEGNVAPPKLKLAPQNYFPGAGAA